MKFLFLSVFLSFSVFAQFEDGSVPVTVDGPKVVVNYGPIYADVEPTAHVVFKYRSCAKYNLTVKTQKKLNNIIAVTIVRPQLQVDCFGPTKNREYSLQLTSTYSGERYVIQNPAFLPVQVNPAHNGL